jgi:NADPH:quinone reductase-like Zn-dependent oxidoreductase
MVQKLGARRAYDYDDKISEKYQLVLDCLGDESRTRAFELVHKGGRLVSVRGDLISLMDERGVIPGLFSAMVELGSEKLVQKAGLDVNYDWAYFTSGSKVLQEFGKLLEKRIIQPVIDSTPFSLREIVQAHEYYEQGKGRGKIIITINQ